jgi:SulP family sulfate permease
VSQSVLEASAKKLRGGDWRLFIPKSITVPRQEGYGAGDFRADLIAGLTVAIVALPLAMAIAIASGATPAAGLITSVVAGFLISALGGSRFQIGGPTGAFIVVVYGVIAAYGFDGLIVATLMAGVILIVAGFLRVGTWIKYVPAPVVTGFTAGIAVIIFTSQVRDLLGLRMTNVPADFIPKVGAFWAARDSVSPMAAAIAAGSLAIILLLRRWAPKAPGFLIAVGAAAAFTALAHANVDTIGSRFGGVPSTLPAPHLPSLPLARVQSLVAPAFTIAFLAGIESLLSAMVADGMTGRRHRSNLELVAQGVANVASALFGGISATGAIARTATNIRAGGRTPIAGMAHATFVFIFMAALGPALSYVPLASLAAVLVVVAWNMSERERVRDLLRGPAGDRAVLAVTFFLTVLVDLTTAIGVGVVLAAIIFMHRMAQATAIERGVSLLDRDEDDLARAREPYEGRAELPRGVEMFVLRGPLFFAATSQLNDALDAAFPPPKAFIIRMGEVPLADASGAGSLARFVRRCQEHRATVIVCEVRPQVAGVLAQMKATGPGGAAVAASYEAALALAAAAAGAPGHDGARG